LAAFVTTLGASGILATIEREYGWKSFIAVALAFAAGVAAIVPTVWRSRMKATSVRWLQLAAAVLFVASLVVGAGFVWGAAGLSGRPSISASLTTAPLVVTGSASADGLRSGDQMIVIVEGLEDTIDSNYDVTVTNSTLLYRTWAGPDSNGDVKIDFAVPITSSKGFTAVRIRAWTNPSAGNCKSGDNVVDRTGCALIAIPPEAESTSTNP
jgi:hypothetical protein